MNRQSLVCYQVFISLAGLILGTAPPVAGSVLEEVLWLVLGLLLYANLLW
ncbi:hypothetical protein [Ectothiorhodospira marina]|nr:hypothetical protein [Ectothiorhodospira marina]